MFENKKQKKKKSDQIRFNDFFPKKKRNEEEKIQFHMFKQLLKIKMWFHEEYKHCNAYTTVYTKTNSYVNKMMCTQNKLCRYY